MRVVIFFLLMVMFSLNVNAISVASDYLKDNTFLLPDGTSKIYGIRLQNPTDREVTLELRYDDTIAKVIDYQDSYVVAPKSKFAIRFNITAPKRLRIDDTYFVSYTVNEVEAKGGGLPLLSRINRQFTVKIVRDPDKFYWNYNYVIYGVIAFVFLTYVLFVYHKVHKKGKFGKAKKIFKSRKIIKWKR